MILRRLDVHFLVISPLHLDGMRGTVARFIPSSYSSSKMSLHVERMWNSGRGLNVILRVNPAQGRPLSILIMVQQFVIGGRMHWIDANHRLVEWGRSHGPTK